VTTAGALLAGAGVDGGERTIDYNREIRPILSSHCFQCHGPDARKRKGLGKPLRLDTAEGAYTDLGGYAAIVRGNAEESEMIRRIASDDADEVMPPRSTGKRMSAREVELLRRWVRQGAPYATHWSYVNPVRPRLPDVRDGAWPRNAIDRFVLARLEREGLAPSAEADRHALIRRVSLDLTGLPPTPDEVERFVRDPNPDAYERLVDRLLARPSYGEHWGRMWLDLARYADSAGYADDPLRTIWAYRDYVIRSINADVPFDQFTIEQLAGDLVPSAAEPSLVATAFHRNTMTNNEGGTNDEEFRNVAVVDRVNTTMAVWMGTTMVCAQCHDHKYDPLTQEEYFRLFAYFNNTEDADRGDESPTLPLYTALQKHQRVAWGREVADLEAVLRTPTPARLAGLARWEGAFSAEPPWRPLRPDGLSSRSGARMTRLDDHSVLVEPSGKTDVYTVELPDVGRRLAALRLETLPHDSLPAKGPGLAAGNFVVSRVQTSITPPGGRRLAGRFVRLELPGKDRILSLAEVQVFDGTDNLARRGTAGQSSTARDGPARLAIDGNTDGRYEEARSTTHTETSADPWWEVDLKFEQPIDRIVVWNRTDNGLQSRLGGVRIVVLDEEHRPIWTEAVAGVPDPSTALAVGGAREVTFAAAYADYSQPSFEAAHVLDNKDPANRGWAVGGRVGQPHELTLVPARPIEIEPGSRLTVTIRQTSRFDEHLIGRFRIAVSDDERAGDYARIPESIRATLRMAPGGRTAEQQSELVRYYLSAAAPELKSERERLAGLRSQLAEMKPGATVPILREIAAGHRRTTRIQRRGNYLDLGAEVGPGIPAAFSTSSKETPADRLGLARWLVAAENPLTARVIANRHWEQIFGTGIVATSEEFGIQGDPPTHPELLDWLATELVRMRWQLKPFVRLLVTSATYRQGSRVTPDRLERDPDNRLLSRGPRVRLDAETVRDQALAVGGLLAGKMYGPPVRPPQPTSGLSAAFGSGIDWQTSPGDDRYRRGLYTAWRRSNPYPSMATFDAPNREVCTVRRSRTNTPLQALVTLNDPVYVEAAQALARRMACGGKSDAERAALGFRLCLCRPPGEQELDRLVGLHRAARETFAKDPEEARQMATDPLGPAPEGTDLADLASWTVVGNVLLNLDEMMMKR
jgi:hypothetical protein